MRYVQIPPDVKLVIKATGKPDLEIDPVSKMAQQKTISHRRFVFGVLIHHPAFCTTVGGRALYKYEQALDAAQDSVMEIEDDVWEVFRRALEKPVYQAAGSSGLQLFDGYPGFNGSGVMQLIPHIDAILEATSKRPAALRALPER